MKSAVRTGVAACLVLALATSSQAAAAPSSPAPPVGSDFRSPDPQDVLVIDTNKGRILLELVPLAAPAHVVRVRDLARQGFYNGRSFFRVIDQFMAQTGDPRDNGTGGSDLPDLAAEFTFRRGMDTPFVRVADQAVAEIGFIGPLPVMTQSSQLMPMTADGRISGWALFCPGVAGMARGGAPDSANSQFFLMRQAYPSLEKRYTAFGRVISGLDVVRVIKTGEPVDPPQDTMTKVQVLADMPPGSRPKVRVIDPRSPWFAAEVARVRAGLGADFTACAISIPSEVK
ncbi:peptidylprolyl isomerase [Phenylobacterium sp.]|uniref:peptidylprolyl isomerase n=1 Tax=Phenylobacterium sp. TaxID=1871053 RepID=UPI0025DFB92D|nr:peptidylprolyl isomerase [Phenylobacterium sp.]MCA3719707.1 peptidylprolyl isomerase [Phenylobacterium sp.]